MPNQTLSVSAIVLLLSFPIVGFAEGLRVWCDNRLSDEQCVSAITLGLEEANCNPTRVECRHSLCSASSEICFMADSEKGCGSNGIALSNHDLINFVKYFPNILADSVRAGHPTIVRSYVRSTNARDRVCADRQKLSAYLNTKYAVPVDSYCSGGPDCFETGGRASR